LHFGLQAQLPDPPAIVDPYGHRHEGALDAAQRSAVDPEVASAQLRMQPLRVPHTVDAPGVHA
jgi:hypothetical protein